MDNAEILKQFIPEALDSLEKAESTVLELEECLQKKGNCDPEMLQVVFRYFHNIKGSSGFLGLDSLILVTHELETLLDQVRKKLKPVSLFLTEILFRSIDELKFILKEIHATGGDVPLSKSGQELLEKIKSELNQNKTALETPKKKKFEIFEDEEIDSLGKEENQLTIDDNKNSNNQSLEYQEVGKTASITKKEIRVPEEKLNHLFNLMGELMIAESNVTQHPIAKSINNDSYQSALNRLHKTLKEFQEETLSLRMVPVQGLFHRMNRVLRDLQKNSDKKAHILYVGEETQIDKSIADALIEPMVHIIRNAFDHGIEEPSERESKGKSPKGKMELHAFQSSNEVWIVAKDDGRGLDRERILAKATQVGLVNSENTLSDEEVFSLIFEHGFSTAQEITEVSGRGVGMDVVKTSVEKLGGKIEIKSSKNLGTSFILRLPLTLGIMEGTTFRIENKFFSVPTVDLKEFVGLREKDQITLDNHTKVIEVRGQFIPIFNINEILPYREKLNYTSENSILLIFQSDTKLIGLIVEEVLGNQSIVIKGMESNYDKAKEISGFTILGDGSISLILDMKVIFKNLSNKL